MESQRHVDQASLFLIDPLRRYFRDIGFVAWVGGNSFVYFPREGRTTASCVGPDVYVVNGGIPRGQEKWVSWEEGDLLPTLIIELVSPSTEKEDRGRKLSIYRDCFHCPDYFLYNTTTQRLDAFRLEGGTYLSVLPDADGAFPCTSLPGLRLGVRDGWLRFVQPDGSLLLTGGERAAQERSNARQERARADRAEAQTEQERARADSLARQLQEAQQRLRLLCEPGQPPS